MNRSKLKVGVDVPWVTSWSVETMAGVGPCATVGGRLAVRQREKPEYGRPLYSMNHFRRQRQTVRDMLCPMCGRPTEAGDRWSQTGKYVPAGVLRGHGLAGSVPPEARDSQLMLDAGSVAPGHRACMEAALKHCPHLRGQADRELKPFPERWTVTPLFLDTMAKPVASAILAKPEAQARSAPVIGFLQLCGLTSSTDRGWRSLL